jgi:hypothetical protein
MTNYAFCDLHKSQENRQTPRESIRNVIVQEWKKVDGKNYIFENKLDVCLQCIKEQIVDRAVGLGVDYSSNWKTEVWQTGKTGKRFKQTMDMDEFSNYLSNMKKEQELAELRARALK